MKTKFRQKLSYVLICGAALTLGGQAAVAQTVVTPAATIPYLEFTLATPAPAPAGATDTWSTPASKALGVTLLAQLDSSGPAAWDMAAHPLVYVSTNGPGYFNAATMSATQKVPGIAIFDANTYQPVASGGYAAQGVTTGSYSENHGVGVSADGKWIYTQGNMPQTVSKADGGAVLLVINAATLKVDKIIQTRVRDVRNIYDKNTNKNLVLIDGWGSFFFLDPGANNTVLGSVEQPALMNSGDLGFGNPAGTYTLISARTGFLGSIGGVAVIDQKTWRVARRVATNDPGPVAVAFSANGKNAYVSGSEDSTISHIETTDANPGNWTQDTISSTSVSGPFGLTMSWDDKTVFAIGKGEASGNMGLTLGIAPAANFVAVDQYRGWSTSIGEVYTGCLRGEHGVVHPDPARNEMWISCSGSFNNVVVDMGTGTLDTVKVKKILMNPNGGSSHGGAMVKYTVSGSTFTGELQSDTNNLQGSAFALKKTRLGL